VTGADGLAAVVFDVDGTLVDSERHCHRVAFNQAFADAGMPDRFGEDLYGQLLAIAGGRDRLRHYLMGQGYTEDAADAVATRLHARKTEIMRAMVIEGRVPARPGAARLLDELAAAGVPVAIATTGSRAWVEPLIDGLFGLGRFAAVLTGDEVPQLKPAPDVYVATLARLDLAPDRVVAIEDAEKGVVAAVGAGMTCLAVVNDYTAGECFDAAALVVDEFGGPGTSRVLAGPPDVLDGAAVTVGTLRRLLGHAR
jgi:HAD superfamily hydrolase (TIGR01509 family)